MIKISIITAVYNNQEHLESCFDSVFSQTHPSIEYIVVDGGSDNGTKDIIHKYSHRIARWISEPDKGIYDALNKGISLATGDVIGFLHSDDLFNSNQTIAHLVESFERHSCDAVYGNLIYVLRTDQNQIVRYWKSGLFNASLLKKGWMPPHPTLFVKRIWFEQKGMFRTDFRIAADYDLILRFFGDNAFKAVFMDEVITRMRTGGASNRSIRNIYRKSREDLIALKDNGIGGWRTLLFKNLQKVLQFVLKPKNTLASKHIRFF